MEVPRLILRGDQNAIDIPKVRGKKYRERRERERGEEREERERDEEGEVVTNFAVATKGPTLELIHKLTVIF